MSICIGVSAFSAPCLESNWHAGFNMQPNAELPICQSKVHLCRFFDRFFDRFADRFFDRFFDRFADRFFCKTFGYFEEFSVSQPTLAVQVLLHEVGCFLCDYSCDDVCVDIALPDPVMPSSCCYSLCKQNSPSCCELAVRVCDSKDCIVLDLCFPRPCHFGLHGIGGVLRQFIAVAFK